MLNHNSEVEWCSAVKITPVGEIRVPKIAQVSEYRVSINGSPGCITVAPDTSYVVVLSNYSGSRDGSFVVASRSVLFCSVCGRG